MNDKVQIFITITIVAMYLYLVGTGKAEVEGFIAIAVYVIKKALDLMEENQKTNGGKNEKVTSISTSS